jgi:hypothetical protein
MIKDESNEVFLIYFLGLSEKYCFSYEEKAYQNKIHINDVSF